MNAGFADRALSRSRRRLMVLLTAAVTALVGSAVVQQQPAHAATWNLVWADEFNGSGAPSSANWNYNVGNGLNPGLNAFDGWGNGEWEWYRPENCTQSGGNLVMRANWLTTPITVNGRNFYQTSCRMTTDTKKSFQYGRIEARMALPTAAGSWPAFWMLGDSCDETSTSAYNPAQTYYDRLPTNWASCGEVDIMEHANANATVTNNIFWDLRTGVFPWTAGQNANYVANPAVNNAAAFHVYAIEWTAAQIRWYIDGVQTHVIDTTPATLEEFRKPFHVIFNLALGGTYPGQNPVQSQFPLTASIDYVRYYQDGGGTTPPSTGGPATQINGPGGKCVDVAGNDTGGIGAAVQLWTCQGPSLSKDQQWSWDGQTLRTLGRCLDVANASTANGTKVQLWDCNGSGAQNWVQEGNRLRNPNSNKCLDSPGGSTADGARLQIWDCNGSAAQYFVKAA